MKYESVIGLEVHTELKTKTKIFCGCRAEFGAAPNTNVCPVCLGLPGVLPVLNRKVLEYAVRVGVALNCKIANFTKFDRKNYYYPDLPKNFQTSQYDLPIAEHGYLDIEVDGQVRRIGITRIHMEEDAGKLVHSGETITTSDHSFVDYNRTGVPLLEIVSEPDLRTAAEARAYMEKLRSILEYLDVSDCKMEEGSLRCDANVSVREVGAKQLGTKVEMKNINSIRGVERSIEYEAQRQAEAVEDGEVIVQETRTWDETAGITRSMRSKEEANDYRYFPEPDLVPFTIEDEYIEQARRNLPELPDAKRERLIRDYGLSLYDAEQITAQKDLADYFDETVAIGADAKEVTNWLIGDFARFANEFQVRAKQAPVQPKQLAGMLAKVNDGTLSGRIAKSVFEEMWHTGKTAESIIEEKGLRQISDTGALETIIREIIAANPQSVQDFQAGKKKAVGFLVGQTMKATKGKANPQLVNQLLMNLLEEI